MSYLFNTSCYVHNHGFCYRQVLCPIVFASSGHCVLLQFGLQDTLSYKVLKKMCNTGLPVSFVCFCVVHVFCVKCTSSVIFFTFQVSNFNPVPPNDDRQAQAVSSVSVRLFFCAYFQVLYWMAADRKPEIKKSTN